MKGRAQAVRAFVSLGLVVAAVGACGGSGSTPAPRNSTSGGAVAPSASLSAAPPALVASHLIDAANLSMAVGSAVTGNQDDGGVSPDATHFVSQAETESRLTRFSVMLTTYDKTASATQAYRQQVGGGTTPLPGVGDEAAYQPGAQVAVRKGAQVLSLRVDATPAGESMLVATAKSPASIQAVLTQPSLQVARALAGQLSGQSLSGQYVEIPAGAVDPCEVSVSELQAALHKSVTMAHTMSQQPPQLMCTYTINGQPFSVSTYTEAQAEAALPPASLKSVFTTDAQMPSHSGILQDTAGPVALYMNPDSDWSAAALFTTSSQTQGLGPIPAPAAQQVSFRGKTTPFVPQGPPLIMVKVRNGYTFVVDIQDCYELFWGAIHDELRAAQKLIFGSLGMDAAATFTKKMSDDVYNWCKALDNPEPTPP
jgi:hypothetical protein